MYVAQKATAESLNNVRTEGYYPGRQDATSGLNLGLSNNVLLHAQRAEIAELKATVKAQGDHIARTEAKLDTQGAQLTTISEQLAHIICNQNIARAGLAPLPMKD